MADFPETRWSIISRARAQNTSERKRALEDFCRSYWSPLYSYARCKGKTEHDAEDLVQSFVLKLLDRPDSFEKLDAERGMLRGWLKRAFSNFMIEEWNRSQAQKRGGGAETITLDLEGVERIEKTLTEQKGPDREFDRQWARTVLSRARRMLRDGHEKAGKLEEFELLRPSLEAGSELSADEIGQRLGKNAGAVRVAISRLRADFRIAVQREVADTIGPDSDVEAEMKYLLQCL